MTEALANAGLESSNLIVGIDFTKSNEWTGYDLSEMLVMYVMSIVEPTECGFFCRQKIIQ